MFCRQKNLDWNLISACQSYRDPEKVTNVSEPQFPPLKSQANSASLIKLCVMIFILNICVSLNELTKQRYWYA